MKHIKLFESFGVEYYQEVDEMVAMKKSENAINMSDTDMKTLTDILGKLYLAERRIDYGLSYIKADKSGVNILIFKLEDDYYLFALYSKSKPIFYICDQMDGLLKYIEDKII